ncbi:CocE/NonD family hydrolase [Amycolatopsis thermoflava]|uniref:CocE/NonD family hydrolase n=1 Tax=Amycolatopsis thermoflava TaxID=84480 RepID=UPI003D7424FD
MPLSLIFERDVAVPVRDGTELRCNVYRPVDDGRYPVLMTLGPYGKDRPLAERAPDLFAEIGGGTFLNWETPDPEYWVPRGYVVVRVDGRGTGASPGPLAPFEPRVADDFYDAIEWAGTQPWCTGKVGLLGISYYAMSQWAVAARRPPHLTAMMPWEGAADMYRDFQRHGGILSARFMRWWWNNAVINVQHGSDGTIDEAGRAALRTDPLLEAVSLPLDGDHYRNWLPDLADIEVPFVSVGNWGNLGLHLRGNIEAYVGASSRHKWLRVITGDHILPFYEPEALRMQEKFFGYWLKGEDTGWLDEPRVRLAIRRGAETGSRDGDGWPLPGTQWTELELDAYDLSLGGEPAGEAEVSYTAPDGGVEFSTAPFTVETEITGPVALRLWVSSSTEDMDIFVRLREIGPDGGETLGISPNGTEVPLALGWLRVSHRELDEKRSLPYRPYHKHSSEQLLSPGQVVPVDVEIWPTSIVVQPGHRLVLGIAGADFPSGNSFFHDDPEDRPASRFAGTNTVHTGGQRRSFLLLPVIR